MTSRRTKIDSSEKFQSELDRPIRDIRSESSANREDMETWYKLKVQEMQEKANKQNLEHSSAMEEIQRTRVQVQDLSEKLAELEAKNSLLEKQTQDLNYQLEDDHRSHEAELRDRDLQIRRLAEERQALAAQVQNLLGTKQTMDAEISIFRTLLDSEENRTGLGTPGEQKATGTAVEHDEPVTTVKEKKEETSSRTSMQRSARGNVSISDVSPEGKFIVVENTHKSTEEPLGGWKIKRIIDGKQEITYTFPSGFVLKPGKSVKVWADGQGGTHSPPEHLIFQDKESFGTGGNVQTILFSKKGEERATHTQRTTRSPS